MHLSPLPSSAIFLHKAFSVPMPCPLFSASTPYDGSYLFVRFIRTPFHPPPTFLWPANALEIRFKVQIKVFFLAHLPHLSIFILLVVLIGRAIVAVYIVIYIIGIVVIPDEDELIPLPHSRSYTRKNKSEHNAEDINRADGWDFGGKSNLNLTFKFMYLSFYFPAGDCLVIIYADLYRLWIVVNRETSITCIKYRIKRCYR